MKKGYSIVSVSQQRLSSVYDSLIKLMEDKDNAHHIEHAHCYLVKESDYEHPEKNMVCQLTDLVDEYEAKLPLNNLSELPSWAAADAHEEV
jgi:hypothetical protein